MEEKKEKQTKNIKNTKNTFTVLQLVNSKQFSYEVDLIRTLLNPNEEYTVDEVKLMIAEFKERTVR